MEATRSLYGQAWSHGRCREGLVPSASRHRRSISWEPWRQQQRVQIDYSKLRELCVHQSTGENNSTGTSRSTDHDRFMAGYASIFRWPQRRVRTSDGTKRHSCQVTDGPGHDITSYMIAIHGRDPREQEEIDLQGRLRAIHSIVTKLPMERSNAEVKQLAQHLQHFPNLLPDPTPPVLTGVATRALIENISKDGSLPGHGGVYLILQGCVEKLTQDPKTRKTTSIILKGGDVFGDFESDQYHLKSSYPMFLASEPCSLLRITAYNYERIVQKHLTVRNREKRQLVESCPLLTSITPSVLTKLAEAISWKTIPENTTILQEGQRIERVAFLQQGRCLAYSRLPHTSRHAQVCVGELLPGSCIGELLLRGQETQPYSVVSVTTLRVGWVPSTVITGNEVDKHVLPESPLAIPVLSQEQLRLKYANKLVKKQWNKIRGDIVSEVLTERGISLGSSKWRHSAAQRKTSDT